MVVPEVPEIPVIQLPTTVDLVVAVVVSWAVRVAAVATQVVELPAIGAVTLPMVVAAVPTILAQPR